MRRSTFFFYHFTKYHSQFKVEEINEIIEMKMTHRKNIERRKAKFGFDSVSKMGLNMVGAFFNPALSFILTNVCQLNKCSTQVGAAVVVPDASDGTEPENPYDGDFCFCRRILLIFLYFQMTGEMWLLILLSWINQRKQKLNLKLRCFGGKWNTQLLIFLALTIPASSRGPAKDNSIKPCIFVDLSIWAWPQLYILWGRTLCTLGLRPLKILIESTMCSVSNSGKAFLETTLRLISQDPTCVPEGDILCPLLFENSTHPC